MRAQGISKAIRRTLGLSLLFGLATCLYCGTAQAFLPPHDTANDIHCLDCHALRGGYGFRPEGVLQEALCKTCHNPTGRASAMPDVGNHLVDDGGTIIDCGSCHDMHIDWGNLKLVRGNTGEHVEGALEPALFRSDPDEFGFGGGTFNAICQSCHSATTYHTNAGAGVAGHFAGLDCTSCHGHEDGFLSMSLDSLSGSHGSHISAAHGPGIACSGTSACHGSYLPPALDDGEALASTTACDECHSPGGSYDGVGDAATGAVASWSDGVYTAGALKSGKEGWCAGCHDEAPSNARADGSGISAPAVIGDETEATDYGTGWGFYLTGHGVPSVSTFPASGRAGAGLGCLDCHEATGAHIDHDDQTYRASQSNYQSGYRLADVAGGAPMVIPKPGSVTNASHFALCFSCHASDPILSNADLTTNFRRDTGAGRNNHARHLQQGGFYSNKWDSDWDDVWNDSAMSCPLCHNVHGSPTPAMMRHGELIVSPGTTYAVPALDFIYTPAAGTPLASSTGGSFSSYTSMLNMNCRACHWSAMLDYSRAPLP